MSKKNLTASVILCVLSLIIAIACVVNPLFSFFNYRFFMLLFMVVFLFIALSTFMNPSRSRNVVFGIFIIVFSVLMALLSGDFLAPKVTAVISVLAAVLLLRKKHEKIPALVIVLLVIAILVQLFSAIRFSSDYASIMNGTADVPYELYSHADVFYQAACDGFGMLVFDIALALALIALGLAQKSRFQSAVEAQREEKPFVPVVVHCVKCDKPLLSDQVVYLGGQPLCQNCAKAFISPPTRQ